MPERSDNAFARSESVKYARTACICAAVRACCCFLQDRQKQAAETVQYSLCEEGTARAAVPVTG